MSQKTYLITVLATARAMSSALVVVATPPQAQKFGVAKG